jgi:cell division protein FtsN
MPTNKLLTYILYAVLFSLVAVAGFKACEMKKEQQLTALEQAKFDQQLRDMGYPEEDIQGGSSYTGGDVTDDAPAADPKAAAAYNQPAATAPAKAQNPYDQPAATAPAAAYDQPAATASGGGRVMDYTNTAEPTDGRYRVVAGSFKIKDNARKQMERIIKMGYADAEVGVYNRGAFAVVVVKRTNSLSEANRIVDDLERRGIDASVIDRERK